MPPKLIAFHLPQFHPIPENDAWWGKGFTEWTNVTRATPRFPGHHQPQLPADLGFYDLRLPEARAAQAELAREYGIHGFCYYHYWFNGKRLLERPVEEILASGKPDFPFCLCWANENWTRRWDGAEQEVLIAQHYNDDDDREHIQYLIPFLRDSRYIRIDDKPLLLIYRARHLPDPKRSLNIWRNEARKAGLGELFICRVENFFNERDDPHELGFDASVDFQPDWMAISDENPSVVLPDEHFVVDYRDLVESQLRRPAVKHLRFPGVTPGWDNSARRKKNAFIVADSSPEAYEHWLTATLRSVGDRPESHQLVFINAWNEWAEGNHLEPDQKFGRRYLEATQRSLDAIDSPASLLAPPLLDPLTHDGFVLREAYHKRTASRKITKAIAALHEQRLATCKPPQIRLLLDATRCDGDALQRSLNAVAAQLCEHWHLDVLSAHPSPGIASSRLDWHTVAPEHATAALYELVQNSAETWFAHLRGGDILAEDALLYVAQCLIDTPEAQLIFTDGDTLGSDDIAPSTWLAPGSNPDWLRSTLTLGGLAVVHRAVAIAALQDINDSPSDVFPLAAMLRALDRDNAIHHLPLTGLSRALPLPDIPLGFRAELLRLHLDRLGEPASIEQGLTPDSCRLRHEHPGAATISVLIPDPDTAEELLRSVEGILSQSGPGAPTIVLPDAPGFNTDVRACLAQLAALDIPNIRVVAVTDGPPGAIANQLAAASATELVLFLACSLAPLEADWLESLASHARRPHVGAVGGRVIGPDGGLIAGLIRLGQMGVAATPYQGVRADYAGNGAELQLDQNCAAVSMQCMMIRRQHFLDLGGFRVERYPARHADVDLCLRLEERGLTTVWTPFATAVATSAPPPPNYGPPDEAAAALLDDWLQKHPIDAYFNRQQTRHCNQPRLQTDIALAHEALPWHPVPRIYTHPADFAGCGEIRIATPLRALSRAGSIQGNGGSRFLGPWDLAMLAPDTIVTQRVFTDIGLEWLHAYRRHSQSLLIYELDDLITRIPRESAHFHEFPKDIERRIATGIGLCDRLVVSTAPLAEAYSQLANETVIAPNLLDDAIWRQLQPARHTGSRIRVGWAGSTSHGGDLALLHETMRTLADEVDWVFLGFCPAALRPYVREYHPAVPIKQYPSALAALGLDIAIAPLAANAFNEAKSNLKLLEYGALGYPVICSNIEPYRGDLPVLRVANTTQQWVAAIRRLAADADERLALGQALQARVQAGWMIDGQRAKWLAAWTRGK